MKKILLSFYLLMSFSMTYAAPDTKVEEVLKKYLKNGFISPNIY